MESTTTCRICSSRVREFVDFGEQPLSDAFRDPAATDEEYFFRLAVGVCEECTMVQLMEEVPRERMFHEDYPYLSSGSSVMRAHFSGLARRFLDTELTGDDPFIVELGCNDGIMLGTVAEAGVRHLGVEPSGGVADRAAAKGVRVRKDFFEAGTAASVLAEDGRADVIYAANTLCHIPYIGSVLEGVDALLAENGVFVFEDPYWAEIVRRNSFDQIYDEHFYFFTAHSVQAMASRYGLELVDVELLPVHGGEARYTLARAGSRPVGASVTRTLRAEQESRLTDEATLTGFATRVRAIRDDLLELLQGLAKEGRKVVGYGATAKSATVLNYCGIGPDLIEYIADTTPAKQGRLTPGSHIPVVPHERFAADRPDHVLLLAWNHAEEIMANERGVRESGGAWIQYVPRVEVG
ncbi:class I SAM-dependent methyltransferase [Nocardiopsis sp. MG754419]|uniref:class I SAM-dependent methyltransferase n=1 Tax=Nocardiopsis sp. MG754419 TaxID=2259865 RepID=UPI001BA4FF08|nr:class I SAM-dependent methyltransferase [Nocardiopsis sp. MG754419]MBR8743451.1 SAM-dependent methyltransferase [Nocardiopsis sp. MG754419]